MACLCLSRSAGRLHLITCCRHRPQLPTDLDFHLQVIFPEADIPVVMLSMMQSFDTQVCSGYFSLLFAMHTRIDCLAWEYIQNLSPCSDE